MSRVEGNIFFQFFFLEKVIIDAINVIKTNKKNLKKSKREPAIYNLKTNKLSADNFKNTRP